MPARPVVLAPDAELVAVDVLRSGLAVRPESYVAGAKVGTRMPAATAPGRYLLVRRVGGTMAGLVFDEPRLDVLVWHEDDAGRVRLANLARAVLLAAPGSTPLGVAVYRVEEFAGPANLPDPLNETRTVTLFTVAIRLRAAPA